MSLSAQIAKHFRDVYFGGNWTAVNLKEALAGITRQQATTQLYSLNNIAALVYHINYYVRAASKVLQGGPLNASDKFSFDLPAVESDKDWQCLLDSLWTDAENFAGLIEQMPESKLEEVFSDEKYGTYYRNVVGIIEHTHYHLGQIVLIKKMLLHTKQGEYKE